MKYIGLTALCAALSMTGLYFSRLHNKKMRLMKTLADFFFSFSQAAVMLETDISECIKRLGNLPKFAGLEFPSFFDERFVFGCDVKEIWNESVNEDKSLIYLDSSAKALLLSFCECFGKYPLNVFSDKCIFYGEQFTGLYQKEEARWEKNRSLVLSSGVLAAAAVFFVLI